MPYLVLLFLAKRHRDRQYYFSAIQGLWVKPFKLNLNQNIFVTTSSACSDNEPATSKVLQAMNINDAVGRSYSFPSVSIRIQ